MMGEPGVDYPEARTPVDVRVQSRGDTLLSFVELVDNGELLLSAGEDHLRRPVRLEPGEHLELTWRAPDELRAVPAELVGVDTGGRATWRVKPIGPAGRGQRRAAVRAPMDYRMTLTAGGRTLEGVSVDLSEGGVRFLVADAAEPAAVLGAEQDPAAGEQQAAADAHVATEPQLEVGSVHQLTLWWDDRDTVITKGEVIRHFPREDKREEVSIRFIGLSEKMEDVIRARVFARLRDLRARGVL
jgi:hypothetical protein